MKSNVAREKNCVELILLATILASMLERGPMIPCKVDTHEAVLLACPGRCSSYSLSERVAENISAGAKGMILRSDKTSACIDQNEDLLHEQKTHEWREKNVDSLGTEVGNS
jgi:hypothetical protein